MDKTSFASPPGPFLQRHRKCRIQDACHARKHGQKHTLTKAAIDDCGISRRALLSAAGLLGASSLASSSMASTYRHWPGSALVAPTVVASALRQSVLFELASGSLFPVSALPHVLSKSSRCILVGEIHDEVETHAAQLATLQQLHETSRNRPVVVAFEQFYRLDNRVLAEYISGAISLDAMLKKTQWDRNWGFDSSLYLPIFRFCRSNRIKMIGMNVPSQVISLISQLGLGGIPKSLRNLLPSEIDTYNSVHREHFLRSMGFDRESDVHPAHRSMLGKIDMWYDAQCTWDEVMSEAIADELSANPDALVVALAGTGHIDTRTAIPDRVQKRTGERPFSIVTRPVAWSSVAGVALPDIEKPERCADVVWYTSRKQDLA